MYSQLTPSIVKERLKSVKDAIRDKLKVDSGTQNTNDIIAVANGYKNYHSVKENENKSFYNIATNLGDNDNQMIVEKDIGYFEYDSQAQEKAKTIIKNCKSNLNWKLLKFGVDTGHIIETSIIPEQGLVANITVYGETYSELYCKIEKFQEDLNLQLISNNPCLLKNNFNFNNNDGFDINVFGNELDNVSEVFFMDTEEFIIFDDTGIIESKNEDEIISRWHDITTNKKSDFYNEMVINGTLRLGASVTKGYATFNDDKTYFVISLRQNSSGEYDIYSGKILDIIDNIKDINKEFSLFVELKNNI
jgi:hypothetical protein